MTAATFDAEQFTPTKCDTGADKARFANAFVRFVDGGFRESDFTQDFYRRLRNTFGHIAHYNREGFWSEYFTTTEGRVRFVEDALSYQAFGDPKFTYSDVEIALQVWLRTHNVLDHVANEMRRDTERRERGLLAALRAKYPDENGQRP